MKDIKLYFMLVVVFIFGQIIIQIKPDVAYYLLDILFILFICLFSPELLNWINKD
jgi:hypothetical protein